MAKREIAERIDGELTVEASRPCPNITDVRRELDPAHDRRAVRSLVLSIRDFPPMKAPPARARAAVLLARRARRIPSPGRRHWGLAGAICGDHGACVGSPSAWRRSANGEAAADAAGAT